jgi:transcriptional regulator with XRE-family HTH domain
MDALQQNSGEPAPASTLTKAVVRAAGLLGLSQVALADVLGVSAATASRLVGGRYVLNPSRRREWEFAVLFVRLYRSLDAIVGTDRGAQSWLRGENHALAARPLDLIRSAEGLVRVLQYLDASRGRI